MIGINKDGKYNIVPENIIEKKEEEKKDEFKTNPIKLNTKRNANNK